MGLQIVPLAEVHLEGAAALFRDRYQALRNRLPLLPAQYAEIPTLLPLLREIAAQRRGAAALDRGGVAGFVAAWQLPSFQGRRAVFSPEWANAARPKDSRRIYEEMYTWLSASWVEQGCRTHLISSLPGEGDALEALLWLGFGMIAADGVRGLEPTLGRAGEATICRAGPGDVDVILALSEALRQHLASAPTFLPHEELEERGELELLLDDPAHAWWLAYDGQEVVAYMKQGPASDDACTIIRDAGTSSIVGAFTQEGQRCRGIATALLNRCLAWARSAGYVRCAVDFEPMNPPAARFWMRHFRPVSYTQVRTIEEEGV